MMMMMIIIIIIINRFREHNIATLTNNNKTNIVFVINDLIVNLVSSPLSDTRVHK
jgi:hypothetical protein